MERFCADCVDKETSPTALCMGCDSDLSNFRPKEEAVWRICENCVDEERRLDITSCIICHRAVGLPNFKPKKEEQMSKLEPPTKEQVLKAAEKRPCLKRGLKELWPGAFEPEPVKMEGKIKNSKGNVIVRVSEDGKRIVLDKCFKWELFEEGRRVNATVTPTRK